MAIVIPDCGERYLLDRALKGTNNGNNYTLKLYTAVAGGLGGSTVAGDFTEATFAGYAAKTLTPGAWGAASTSTGTSTSTYGALQTYTRSSSGAVESIAGYYLIDASTGTLILAEEFVDTEATPIPSPIANVGDKVELTPALQLASA